MKTVNVRQLKNNPSDALRMARKAPVVVMNRDKPEAVLFHLDDEGLLAEPGVRLAIATDLYKNDSVSLSRGAKIAGMPLEAFMVEMGRAGIPVVKGDAGTLREDLKNIDAWRKRRPSSTRVR
jgi:predicted HTH domain antitoxin